VDRPIRMNNVLETNVVEALNTFAYVQSDSALFHLFFMFFTLILLGFFYGTMDKFLLQNGEEIEFPIIVIFIAGSALILFYAHTLIEFLIALETLTLASYVCAGYERQNRHSTYASVQYFILGSIPSGFLILGMGLLYSQTGVLNFEDLDLMCYNNSSFQADNSLMIIKQELELDIDSELHSNLALEYVENYGNYYLYKDPAATFFQLFFCQMDQTYVYHYVYRDEFFTSFLDTQANPKLILTVEELISTKTPAFLIAILFILCNLLFKLTAAPFHF